MKVLSTAELTTVSGGTVDEIVVYGSRISIMGGTPEADALRSAFNSALTTNIMNHLARAEAASHPPGEGGGFPLDPRIITPPDNDDGEYREAEEDAWEEYGRENDGQDWSVEYNENFNVYHASYTDSDGIRTIVVIDGDRTAPTS